MRRVVVLAVIAALAVAASAGARPAASAKHCTSVRVDRFLHTAHHGVFGAFGILARGTGCVTARRVASSYVHAPGGPASTRTSFVGWTCTFSGSHVPQEIRVTCRRGSGRVTFRDVLPNG